MLYSEVSEIMDSYTNPTVWWDYDDYTYDNLTVTQEDTDTYITGLATFDGETDVIKIYDYNNVGMAVGEHDIVTLATPYWVNLKMQMSDSLRWSIFKTTGPVGTSIAIRMRLGTLQIRDFDSVAGDKFTAIMLVSSNTWYNIEMYTDGITTNVYVNGDLKGNWKNNTQGVTTVTNMRYKSQRAATSYNTYFTNIYIGEDRYPGAEIVDGDLSDNAFLDNAGYFRNISSDKEPYGVGILSKETDRGAVTIASTTISLMTKYLKELRYKIENYTGHGELWNIIEEHKVSYYTPQYQKTVIIERKRLI